VFAIGDLYIAFSLEIAYNMRRKSLWENI